MYESLHQFPYNVEFRILELTEAALHRCSHKKVFWKYTLNLQENTHAEVHFSTLLKSHFTMGALLLIQCILSEKLFLRTPLEGLFWMEGSWDLK